MFLVPVLVIIGYLLSLIIFLTVGKVDPIIEKGDGNDGVDTNVGNVFIINFSLTTYF